MGSMGKAKSVLIAFDEEFLANLKKAAELKGMRFSEFVRKAAAEEAARIFLAYGEDGDEDWSAWRMNVGGDYSEARAAKGKNYKKRTNKKKEEK